MKSMAGALVLVLSLVAIAIAALPLSAEDPVQPLPEELYPDADAIISSDDEGNVIVTTRTVDDGVISYTKQIIRNGADLRVFRSSGISGPVSVVMIGGSLNNLTLLTLDDNPSEQISLSFEMVSGTVEEITAVSLLGSMQPSFPDSYYSDYYPVGSLDICIRGDVGEFVTTSGLVGVGSLHLEVADDAVIDRLFPTGENGRYRSVEICINGGTIGYMSHQRAVVTDMTCRFNQGSLDYLSLGADTEGGSGYYRENLWTFYVQDSVEIHFTQLFHCGHIILGGGILEPPSVLCNSELPVTSMFRSIEIDGSDTSIMLDSCFHTGDKVYRFSSYSVGSNPQSYVQRTSYYDGEDNRQLYGDDGIWTASSGAVLPIGAVLYLNACLAVSDGATFIVEEGATVVNSGIMIVSGGIVNEGIVRNSGVIEKHDGGTYEGEVEGPGFVATCIYARTNDGRIDIMTVTDDAVVMMSSSGSLLFNTASVRFGSSDSMVLIFAPESIYVGGYRFLVSLSEIDPGDDLYSWNLFITGFDSGSADIVTVEVTVPVNLPTGFEGQVVDSDGNQMEIVSQSRTELTFIASGNGAYSYRSVVEEPDVDPEDDNDLLINSIIAIAIVIVASVAVFFLLRHDRGREPSSGRSRHPSRGGERFLEHRIPS